jgi:glycosyltransferase involved in cell wall biosynthesis
MKPPVSVYIPCYNVAEFIARSIEGVLRQAHPADEILVVDDGSRDATLEIAARYPVRIVRHEKNLGLAAARNTAFREARNEFVASLDADCVAAPDWLEKLVPHLQDPQVAGVAGRLTEGIQRSLADRWRRAHMPQEWGSAAIRNPRFLFGSNTLFRKSTVEAAGGYNESMRTNGEDADLSKRILARGLELIYDPAAGVTHLRHDTIRSILDTYWRWWRFGVRAYFNGVRLRSVLGHAVFVHFRYNFLDVVKADLKARRFELLGLDLLVLGYFPYRDFRLWLARLNAPSPQRASSEV